jgi:hypothetical protein
MITMRLFLLLLFLLSQTVAGRSEQLHIGHIDSAATVNIESDLQWSRESGPLPDFSVYYLRRGQRILLGVYVGNAPDVVLSELRYKMPIGACTAVSNLAHDQVSNDFDTVVALGGANFPRYLHFFSRRLSQSDLRDVEVVLKSFQTVPPYRCEPPS